MYVSHFKAIVKLENRKSNSIVKLENDTSSYRRLDSSWLEPLCEHLADILQNISHSELWTWRRSHAACAVACRKCDSSKFFEICSHTLWY